MWRGLKGFIARWAGWFGARWKVAYVEDPPTTTKPGTLYVVGSPAEPFQAVMACPCGCRDSIWMDLIPGDGEYWKLRRERNGRATLSPSVWKTDGCRSHFWLRDGRVRWCD